MRPRYRLERIGTRYLKLACEDPPSLELTKWLISARESLMTLPQVVEALYGYRSLLVEVADNSDSLFESLGSLAVDVAEEHDSNHVVPVQYDGPDLDWVLSYLRVSIRELVQLHSDQNYHVVALGSPGFVYLSLTPPELKVPRLDSPRARVPPGAVGIAGTQTGIYGSARPGGWRIIGRCTRVPQLRPGDTVRLIPT